jgi:hypothetical protein
MDEQDARELIWRLCTAAGMIMENASASAICRPPTHHADLLSHLESLSRSGADVRMLAAAAAVISERFVSGAPVA